MSGGQVQSLLRQDNMIKPDGFSAHDLQGSDPECQALDGAVISTRNYSKLLGVPHSSMQETVKTPQNLLCEKTEAGPCFGRCHSDHLKLYGY